MCFGRRCGAVVARVTFVALRRHPRVEALEIAAASNRSLVGQRESEPATGARRSRARRGVASRWAPGRVRARGRARRRAACRARARRADSFVRPFLGRRRGRPAARIALPRRRPRDAWSRSARNAATALDHAQLIAERREQERAAADRRLRADRVACRAHARQHQGLRDARPRRGRPGRGVASGRAARLRPHARRRHGPLGCRALRSDADRVRRMARRSARLGQRAGARRDAGGSTAPSSSARR